MSAPLVSDDKLPGMLAAGLERFLDAGKGARLDRRAATAGYYAAAAMFAASQGKESAMVGLLAERASNAIERKESKQ